MPNPDLCTCFAMPTPHRHVTAELSTRDTDRPPPTVTVDPIPSRIVVKYWCGWGGPSHRVTATHFVHVAGKTVDYACDRHTDLKHWRNHG